MQPVCWLALWGPPSCRCSSASSASLSANGCRYTRLPMSVARWRAGGSPFLLGRPGPAERPIARVRGWRLAARCASTDITPAPTSAANRKCTPRGQATLAPQGRPGPVAVLRRGGQSSYRSLLLRPSALGAWSRGRHVRWSPVTSCRERFSAVNPYTWRSSPRFTQPGDTDDLG